MPILIDPPVGPYSPPAAIEQWMAELRELAKRHVDDVDARRAIERAIRDAKQWLAPNEEDDHAG